MEPSKFYTPTNPVEPRAVSKYHTPSVKIDSMPESYLLNVDRSSVYDEGYNPLTVKGSQEDYRSYNQG